ncbi:MAG TPA: hypothetical protein VH640_20550 [Bryobacteraceae bacterium]
MSLARDLVEAGSTAQGLLKNAVQATERAAMLTKQILAYAGKGEFLVEPVNLSALVRKTMRLIGGAIPGNVQVELSLKEGLPPVRADETQLEQVAMNLILNAAEAIGDGGGKVTVRTGIENLDRAAAAKLYDIGQPAPGRYIVWKWRIPEPGSMPPSNPTFSTRFSRRNSWAAD